MPLACLGARAFALGWRASPGASAALIALTSSAGLLPAGTAYLSKLLFDELTQPEQAHQRTLVLLVAAGALLTGATAVLSYASGYVSLLLQQRLRVRAETDLYGRVNAFVGLRPFEDARFHNRVLLAERAVEQAPRDVTSFLVMLVQRTAGVAAYVGVLLALWPPMAVLLLLTAVPAAVMHHALAGQQTAIVEATVGAQRRHDYYRQLSTDAAAAKETRAYGLAALFQGRLIDSLVRYTSAELRHSAKATHVEIWFALLNAAVAGVGTAVAVRGVASGTVTTGDLVFFLAGTVSVQGALTGIASQYGEVVNSLQLFRHYLAVVDAPPDLDASGTLVAPPLQSGLEIRDVWFRYDQDGPWVLRGLNLHLPAGRSLGIVGLNGAGKSTLVKLLLRFYDPNRGSILWDGIPLPDLQVATLRQRIGITFQDFLEYELTAAENVGLGDLNHRDDPAKIRAAAARANIDETLTGLPDGYDTQLGREHLDEHGRQGVDLSGGQWQRVALARSFMRADRDLLVLDEPSAHLDPDSEHLVHGLLGQLRIGRTSLLISHRLNALRGADTIAVVDSGRVVEQGSHDTLMAAGSTYARLFALQASGYQDKRAGVAATG